MTSRLKKKLDTMGVDIQSNSQRLTENFCLIGTPLPPLENSKDTGEFVPLWKQEVRDEQGRRRLHGAFTGGFSAGYYNTVGSKEGWVPSTFSSSRSERASKKKAKPEDFMDEEDLAEMRESKKLIDTTEETDIFGGTQAELARRGDELEKDAIANALESLLPPAKDSVGARLLKKMGWRLGQGIGPRITYKQLRAQEGRPIKEDEVVDEEANKHLYAPRDTMTIRFQKKENAFGVGYVPGQGLGDVIQGRNGQTVESGPNLSAGFGLGALNDAEDDDIDIYDHSASKEHRRMAYDVGDNEDDDRIALGSNNPPAGKRGGSIILSATFRDGRPIVSGFILFDKPLIEDRWFPIPDVPKGWTPDPRRVWAADTANKENNSPRFAKASAQQDHHAWMKGMTADERGSMLGETPLPSAPRSVFDYLSQKDRDRLKTLSSSLASGTLPPQQPSPPIAIDVPRTDPRTAQAALKGFQPFTSDPMKQARYTTYLQSQASPDVPELKPMANQSNESFNKELSDYAKAAKIFKPVSGAMAGRFASASTIETVGNTHQGLHKPTKDDYARLDAHKDDEAKKEEESPKAHAAKMGIFGPLTREVKVWQPARLLCRRFGVKDPYPDGIPGEEPIATTSSAKSDAWQTEVLNSAPNFAAASSYAVTSDSSTPPTTIQKGRRDFENVGMGEDEEQGKETLTYERPAKDIFKAIFASDEEDSGEDDAQSDEPKKTNETSGDGLINTTDVPKEVPKAKIYQPPGLEGRATETVDLTSFRPTFVPKSERDERKVKDQDRKGRKDKDKKKKGKMVVSFDVEDESKDQVKAVKERKDRPRKRQKDKHQPEADDDNMWVEKPPPAVVKDLVIPVSIQPEEADGIPHPRGRKRAVDFL